MGTKFRQVQIMGLLLFPVMACAQATRLNAEKQQLLLQLSLNYFTVVKEGRVDQDSSLLLVSQRNRLSRWTVIADGFENGLTQASNKWIDSRQTEEARVKLASLRGTEHLQLLVLLGAYYAFQPGYRQIDRDSAQYFLTEAKQESELLHSKHWLNQCLILLGKNYFKANRVKEGNECFYKVINTCQRSGEKAMEAKAWDYLGTYLPPVPATFMHKINGVVKANDIYKLTGQTAKQVNTLMNMAYLKFVIKDIKGAEKNALEAISLQKKLNFPYLHYTYDILSLLSATNSVQHKDLGYEVKALQSALATKDSLGLGYFYIRLGIVKSKQKGAHDDYSAYWIRKAVNEFSNKRDPDIYFALFNLTNNLSEAGKRSEANDYIQRTLKNIPPINDRVKMMAFLALANNYQELKNSRQAEKYFLMAEQLQKSDRLITADFRTSFVKYLIGVFYFGIKNYDKAEAYLQGYIKVQGPKENELIRLSDVYMKLYKIDSLRGNYESAARHLHQYIRLNDQVVSINDAKSVAGLKLQFLMSQKIKDLQVLQAKSDLQNQQAATTRKFIYIGLATAILIIVMLYGRYYSNRRQKKELLKVINEKNELLISKEWLLKEVHHRVKNNLHTVICLLESQAGYLENDALKAIESSQHRIYAMSLIHQKLYQSEDIKTVDMSTYLPEFVGYLRDSFETRNRIHFELDIDSIKLSVAYAVPLSLIINEAVTNAIKYAFPGFKKGVVCISLKEIGDQITVTIADNGIGINEKRLHTNADSLGLNLLKGLSEDIKADCRIENMGGTIIAIVFKIEEFLYAKVV